MLLRVIAQHSILSHKQNACRFSPSGGRKKIDCGQRRRSDAGGGAVE